MSPSELGTALPAPDGRLLWAGIEFSVERVPDAVSVFMTRSGGFMAILFVVTVTIGVLIVRRLIREV